MRIEIDNLGPIWSPDAGPGWIDGDTVFWPDGSVTVLDGGKALRMTHKQYGEDYSRIEGGEHADLRRQALERCRKRREEGITRERISRLARLWTASLIRAALMRSYSDGGELARGAPPVVAAATAQDATLRRDVIAELARIMEDMEQ